MKASKKLFNGIQSSLLLSVRILEVYLHFENFKDALVIDHHFSFDGVELELVLCYTSQRYLLGEIYHSQPLEQGLLVQSVYHRVLLRVWIWVVSRCGSKVFVELFSIIDVHSLFTSRTLACLRIDGLSCAVWSPMTFGITIGILRSWVRYDTLHGFSTWSKICTSPAALIFSMLNLTASTLACFLAVTPCAVL